MTKKRLFSSAKALDALIARYFTHIASGDNTAKTKTVRKRKNTGVLDEPGFPTFYGLIHYLGFVSPEEFEEYENKSRFSTSLKRARLRMAAIYEKKLHMHSYGGAAIALKNIMSEKQNHNIPETTDNNPPKVEIIHSGIVPAAYEKEVIL